MTRLEELIAQATPLPWKPGLREPDVSMRKANELLFIHTTNMLPKMVEALKIVLPRVECKWDEGSQVCSVCGEKVWKYGHDEGFANHRRRQE